MPNATLEGLSRREFLALGPALALVPGVVLPSSPAGARALGALAGLSGRGDEPVSIGYWLGSETVASFDALSHTAQPFFADARNEPIDQEACAEPICADVIDAKALNAGDARLGRGGARIRIHGLFAADRRAFDDLPSLSIDVGFAPFHETPFHAWAFENAGAPSVRPEIAFDVPIARTTGLTLSLGVGDPGGPPTGEARGAKRVVTRFTLGTETGTPKLRRGVYLIAWRRPGSGPPPSWRRYRVLATGRDDGHGADGGALFSRLVGRWNEHARLAYVMLSVDHAGSGSTV